MTDVGGIDSSRLASLIERMESRHGIHTVERAFELGLGSREYEIIEIYII